MTKPLAFSATYSDWKLVKTRGVIQVVLEVPLADADAAYAVLGGMPNPASENWFGVAPIQQPAKAPRETKRWVDTSPAQQAGIRCEEPIFQAFLREEYPDFWRENENAADVVRSLCAVSSRSELATNQKARVIWHQLDTKFEAWKRIEA